MLCYQCEQTARGKGCTARGVCGKEPDVSALQDLLVHALKGIGMYSHRSRAMGAVDGKVDAFMNEGLFATLTNVNFDAERFSKFLLQAAGIRDRAESLYRNACSEAGSEPEDFDGPSAWRPADSLSGLVEQGISTGILSRKEKHGDDIVGLQELLTYGLKGLAAYAYHARVLGKEDDRVYSFVHRALDSLAGNETSVDKLLALNLECGEVNLKAMELLDAANTEAFGHPVPTPVRIEPLRGKAILISGHDLKDLDELLKQTAGKGINVYTHGEMLPAHGYPGLKKYGHLAGNYGGAWQDQGREFEAFPGSILMTTNCLQKPRDTYRDRLFTSGMAGWPGIRHIEGHDLTPVIDAALAEKGFEKDGAATTITVGFARSAVLGVADKVISAVKSGAIRHLFLIGGCDGAASGRNYYTQIAEAVPGDCIILTLGCGKYRFNKLDFGAIDGIPRLLDIGQCNDAYSAVQIAVALAGAFNVGVNELPLSIICSWYEQKAVAILLTLLSLGIKNIRLGPSLPAFIAPEVLKVLVEKFNIMPISTPQEDLKAILG